MCDHQHPLFCIVPPHLLQSIAENGTPEQQEQARQNLVVGGQMRVQRAVAGSKTPEVPKGVSTDKQRVVFDGQNGSTLPGVEVRAEGQPPTGDAAVDEAYDGAGATYDLYNEIYDRNSIDNYGMRIDSTVHYKVGYDNAFWNGQRMVYGDGDENLPEDQRIFNRFTSAIDIIGHELTHGVTQFSAGLKYRDQPGALNESMSDVFGSMVKQRVLNQTAAEADWIIGAGLFTEKVNGVGIRSMSAPGTAYDDPTLGKDPQPGHMDDYVDTTSDNGGVHINSGIPNHAFYATAVKLGGHAWDKAGRIWYATLRDKLNENSQFVDAARLTHATAGELYGQDSPEQQAVGHGWAEVGIIIPVDNDNGGGTDNGGGGSTEPSGCSPTAMIEAVFRGLFD